MRRYYIIGLVILLGTGCTKYPKPAGVAGSQLQLLQYAAQDTNLTLYEMALQRAGMTTDSTFSSGGPYTVFAAQDSAFLQQGMTAAVIKAFDTAALRSILEYSIINGRTSDQDLTGFYTEQVTSLNPLYEPTLTKNYYGIFLNGAPVVKPDIELGDGVMQETGHLILPPTGNLMQEVDSLPELSFFAAALHKNAFLRSFLLMPNPTAPDYNTGGSYFGITLLAPTNSAFMDFGFADTLAVQAADSAYMEHLLGAYIYAGAHYTSEFLGGAIFGGGSLPNFPPLYYQANFGQPGIFSVEANGMTFQSTANVLYTVQIIKPDITATNGVMQELNNILIVQ